MCEEEWSISQKKIKQRKIAEENKNKIRTKKKWDFRQNVILAKSNHLGQFVNEQHKTKQNNCALDNKKNLKWNYAAFQLPNNLCKITSCEFLFFLHQNFPLLPHMI